MERRTRPRTSAPSPRTVHGKRYRFTYSRPAQADPLGRLAILFDGRGRVWIDQVSLMPGDAVDDVRADVFERSGNVVEMSAVSDLVNGWSGGIIEASRHDVFVTPTYEVIRLHNEHLGRDRLAAHVSSPVFDSSKEGTQVPALGIVATRSADGRLLFVKAVNTGRQPALKTTVTVTGAMVGAGGTMRTVTGDSLEASNSFRTPRAVAVRTRSFQSSPRFTVDLPPHSVSVLTLPLSVASSRYSRQVFAAQTARSM